MILHRTALPFYVGDYNQPILLCILPYTTLYVVTKLIGGLMVNVHRSVSIQHQRHHECTAKYCVGFVGTSYVSRLILDLTLTNFSGLMEASSVYPAIYGQTNWLPFAVIWFEPSANFLAIFNFKEHVVSIPGWFKYSWFWI